MWNDEGQLFYEDRSPAEVEQFLRLYIEDDTLVLCKFTRYENQSNGYPYWRFDYTTNKKQKEMKETILIISVILVLILIFFDGDDSSGGSSGNVALS